MPVIQEYRDNYGCKGSAAGEARAERVREVLNHFYDGEVDGQYAANDTGRPLGNLLLNTTRRCPVSGMGLRRCNAESCTD